MSHRSPIILGSLVGIFLLGLAACASPTPTLLAASPSPLPPTSTATPLPPTRTPIPPTFTLFPTRTRTTPTISPTLHPVWTYTLGPGTPSATPIPTALPGELLATPTPTVNLTMDLTTTLSTSLTAAPSAEATTSPTSAFRDLGIVINQSPQDGLVVSPGQAVQVTWTFYNSGTTTWDAGYGLRWVGGMSGYGAPQGNLILLPQAVNPGGSINLEVTLTAPNKVGSAFTLWYLVNLTTGDNFAKAYLEVNVK